KGIIEALDLVEKISGQSSINAIGYCIGGTLMSATLAYMKTKSDDRVDTCTFFTTMVDFSEPGQLGVFVDEQQLSMAEAEMEQKGFFDGSNMSQVFNLLRAKDLVWSFVIHNYLMGKDPFPFDLLYWNSDSTRMPPAMHKFYLRKFYLENKLIEPGGVSFNGVDIDLANVQIPTYTISAVEDHIAPWTSTYAATQLFTGERTFVLGGSGHIAGIVNPPAANKYCHWTNTDLPADPIEWKEAAEQHAGSWWDHWQKWVAGKSRAKKVAARIPGDGDLEVIEAAPGAYVSKRLDAE
ncbi:MAG: PHA/PHB synthase family protein, partial [Granulosicoccaceae bacterium]